MISDNFFHHPTGTSAESCKDFTNLLPEEQEDFGKTQKTKGVKLGIIDELYRTAEAIVERIVIFAGYVHFVYPIKTNIIRKFPNCKYLG